MTEDSQPDPTPAPDRRRGRRTRTWLPVPLALATAPTELWECILVDLSDLGCAIYFEEPVAPSETVLLHLPGRAEPAAGRVILDKGEIKHIAFLDTVDVGAVLRAAAAAGG